MKVFKRSKAYGALEYTLIIALIIVIAILILNFIRNRTHGVTWIDSASDKVSEYIGGSPSGPGGPGGTPVGSNIELYFPAAKPVFDIKEGETLTKEQIKQYITDNNGVVRNKTTLAEIPAYEIEDITYNPFDPSVYIQFKVTSLEGDIVSQIPGNILAELADGCVLATDTDFDGDIDGEFWYKGTATCVKIPHVIKGVNITSYKEMFSYTNVEKIISNNSNVTNTQAMFEGNSAASLDVSSLYVSNVTNMFQMFSFSDATDINFGLSFDTSNVLYMEEMFQGAKITSLDLSTFITEKVIYMDWMFSGLNIDTLDLTNFDTSNVISMINMFEDVSVNEIIFGPKFTTLSVSDMRYMFSGVNIKSLNLSGLNTSNVTDMQGMFLGLNTTEIIFGTTFNTSAVTNMNIMFKESQIQFLDLSGFNTLNVTSINGMFNGATIESLNLSSFNTSNVIYMRDMFYNSKILSIDLSSFDFSKVLDISNIFGNSLSTEVFVKDSDSKTKLDNSSNKPAHTIIKIK